MALSRLASREPLTQPEGLIGFMPDKALSAATDWDLASR